MGLFVCLFNDRACNRGLALLCERANQASPHRALWIPALFRHPFHALQSSCAKTNSNIVTRVSR